MIIDSPMHVIPAWYGYRNGVRAVVGTGYGKVRIEGESAERWMPPSFTTCTVSPELVLEYMNWIRVDKAVLMQAPVYGVHQDFAKVLLSGLFGMLVG